MKVDLRRLSPCRAADVGDAVESRPEPRRQGSRPQRAAELSRVRAEGAGGGFGEVAGPGAIERVPCSMLIACTAAAYHRPMPSASRGKERRRVGGIISTPLHSGEPGPTISAQAGSILPSNSQRKV